MSAAHQLRYGFPFYPAGGSTPAFSTFLLDQTTDAQEFICLAPEVATLTRLGFRYGVRTGTPPTFKISLQGVTGAGVPDGTIKGGGSPASATFTPPADTTWDSTWRWITLDNAYTCARGEGLAVVIKYDSGTIDASNNSTFTELINGGSENRGFPYAINNAAGSRSFRPLLPVFGYASASKAFGNPCETMVAQAIFGSTGTPDECGMKFTIPSTWFSTFKVVGLRVYGGLNTGGTVAFTIYDTDGSSILQQVTFDTDWSASTSFSAYDVPFDEVTLSTLTAGSAYTLGFAPGTPTITVYGLQVDSAADWDAWPGGQDFIFRTRTDAGAWTDDATKRLLAELVFDDVTGGGGKLVGPGGGLVG